jgi:hypothetical protein
VRPEWLDRPVWGLLFLILALGPALLAWTRRDSARETGLDAPLALATGTAMLLLGIAAWQLLPPNLIAAAWLLIAVAAASAARRTTDEAIPALALFAAGIASLWAAERVPQLWETLLLSLVGEPALASRLPGVGAGLQLLLLPAALLALLWRLLPSPLPQVRPAPLAVAGVFAGLFVYLLFKQGFGLSSDADFVARGFAERTIVTQALSPVSGIGVGG